MLTVGAACLPALADALDDIRARGVLIWGGDQEGGGPFMYPDPDNPEQVIGFEVEVAEVIARRLGVRAQFFQGAWDTLPQFLDNRQIDIVLNGYEWTPDRAGYMLASQPYYIYELQLLARERDTRFSTIEDLGRPPKGRRYRVGALEGSAAATYLREQFPDTVEIRSYDGNTNAMTAVGSGIDDATLQDLPIAIFYRDLEPGRGLKFVGSPVAPGQYVIYARLGEDRLIREINEAISQAYVEGDLRRIYEKYGLWNAAQERLATAPAHTQQGKAVAGWEVVRRYLRVLLRAAGVTVQIAVMAMPIAIVLGLLVAVGRMYGPWPVRKLLGFYVEVLRGTPVMLQLLVLYFLVLRLLPGAPPDWFMAHWPMIAAVVGLAINYSAYEAEIYRAGLQAVPTGQMDAALALGMKRRTAIRRIIVPQAVRIVVPPVANDFIALFKDTSICSVIAVVELTKQYNILVSSTGAIVELAILASLLYLMMSYPLSLLARYLEWRMSRPAGGAAVQRDPVAAI